MPAHPQRPVQRQPEQRRMAISPGRSAAALLVLVAAVAALAALCGPAHAESERQASVMVVFDGSGSMWSKMPGSNGTRLTAARDAVKAGLAPLAANSRLGLISFGHRQQGSCSDIQTLVPLDGGDAAARISAALDKLSPRGKGPFVQSVREAAAALKTAPGDRHILLLHDDPDNCQQDPCQAAREINAADPGLKVHVVSIGMRADDPGRPVCLARTTGGRAVLIETAAELGLAVADILGSLGSPATVKPATAAASSSSAGETRNPDKSVENRPPRVGAGQTAGLIARTVPTTGPPRLLLAARLSQAGPLLDVPLRWRVAREDDTAAPVEERLGAAPEIALAAGRYKVTVDTGALTRTEVVDVKREGATELVLNLDAALIRLAAISRRGGGVSASAALVLRRPGPAGEVMWVGFGSTPGLVTAAGDLVAQASEGSARVEKPFLAEAGKTVDLELPLDAGRLKLATVAREGGAPLTDLIYRILEEDPGAAGGLREVARSSAAAPDFVLPVGAYIVAVTQDRAEVRERIVIHSGEEVARVLVLGAARVRFDARVVGPPNVADMPIVYTLRRIDAPAGTTAPAPIIGTTQRRPSARIDAGRYRVELRVGDQNARLERELEIRPASDVTVNTTIAVGQVELSATDATGTLLSSDLTWEVATTSGQRVWRTMQARPRLLLEPGTYTFALEDSAGRRSKRFEVTAGASRLEFGPE